MKMSLVPDAYPLAARKGCTVCVPHLDPTVVVLIEPLLRALHGEDVVAVEGADEVAIGEVLDGALVACVGAGVGGSEEGAKEDVFLDEVERRGRIAVDNIGGEPGEAELVHLGVHGFQMIVIHGVDVTGDGARLVTRCALRTNIFHSLMSRDAILLHGILECVLFHPLPQLLFTAAQVDVHKTLLVLRRDAGEYNVHVRRLVKDGEMDANDFLQPSANVLGNKRGMDLQERA